MRVRTVNMEGASQMKKDDLFAMVAEKKLQIKTLATRHSDELDFHDVSVWQVREAFEQIWRVREDEVRTLQKMDQDT